MDEYGATNPAEFFAVATETFFEKPHAMKSWHPELYKVLKGYYKLDPVEWGEDTSKKSS
jgi:Mlc titration factor MtfA (ptsG expression regulator)